MPEDMSQLRVFTLLTKTLKTITIWCVDKYLLEILKYKIHFCKNLRFRNDNGMLRMMKRS